MSTYRARLLKAARDFWGGPVQQQWSLAPGVLAVSTPGHGGIVVDLDTFPLPEALREGMDGNVLKWTYTSTGAEAHRVVGFEEDCSWAVLLLAKPELMAKAVAKYVVGLASLTADEQRQRMLSYLYPRGIVALYNAGAITVAEATPLLERHGVNMGWAPGQG